VLHQIARENPIVGGNDYRIRIQFGNRATHGARRCIGNQGRIGFGSEPHDWISGIGRANKAHHIEAGV
jgi:hypothetical protein